MWSERDDCFFMNRFFINTDAFQGEVVEITGSDFNHISHSLRLKIGNKIIVATGDGWDYIVELTDFKEGKVIGNIIDKRPNITEPSINVTLAQAIPKKNNMDLIVQKSTEIGINKIIPLETSRTVVKLKGNKKDKRRKRWQKIAEEAAKQSQRGIIPVVEMIHDIKDLKSIMNKYDLVLVPWEEERATGLKKIWSDNVENILLVIGPEGGFPIDEIDYLKKYGGKPITLGPRILRTETAGLVALSMILYESGNLGG